MKYVGVISDTHGLLRPAVLDALRSSDLIIHAGDVGDPAILDEFRDIAPVYAVRGNVDYGAWANALPEKEWVEVEGRLIHIIHDLEELDVDPKTSQVDLIISGHSHKPHWYEKNGIWYLNPGSIGPRRFDLPISLALVEVSQNQIQPNFIDLEKV